MVKKKKPGEKRKKFERQHDRKRIIELYLQGRLQDEIAKELKCTQQQVSYDIRAVRKQWVKKMLFDFHEKKAEELARIDLLEVTYWKAWERSLGYIPPDAAPGTLGVMRTVTHHYKPNEDGIPTETGMTVTDISTIGNLACLAAIERCITARIRLLGLDVLQGAGEGDFNIERWQLDVMPRLLDAINTVEGTILHETDPNIIVA